MKKTLITALMALAATTGFAQNLSFGSSSPEGLSVVGQFGMNISNFRMNEIPWGNMDPKAGFNFGIHAEYMLPECYGLYLNAGVEYSMKGAKDRLEAEPGGIGATFVSRPMYLSVPIHVGYRYDVLEELGVYADFGPYFALGTNGKNVVKMDDYSEDVSTKFFLNDDSGFYKLQRPEFGLGFRIGAEYAQHYNLIVSCDWGITDMLTQSQKHDLVSTTGFKNPYMKNFAAGITFGYRF